MTAFFNDYQIINQDLKKHSLSEKNQASYAGFVQSCRYYAVTEKNLLITGFLGKFCFI